MKTVEQLKAAAFDNVAMEAKKLESSWSAENRDIAKIIRLVLADALMKASQQP